MDGESVAAGLPSSPQSKADLIERIRRSYTALDQEISQLNDTQLTDLRTDGGWSVKDMLAHITVWEQILLESYLRGRPFHDVVGLDSGRAQQLNTDEINEHMYRRDQSRPLPVVLAAFRQSYQQVLDELDSVPESMLFAPYTRPGSDSPASEPLINWVIGNTYEHYDEHLATIQALTTAALEQAR